MNLVLASARIIELPLAKAQFSSARSNFQDSFSVVPLLINTYLESVFSSPNDSPCHTPVEDSTKGTKRPPARETSLIVLTFLLAKWFLQNVFDSKLVVWLVVYFRDYTFRKTIHHCHVVNSFFGESRDIWTTISPGTVVFVARCSINECSISDSLGIDPSK